MCHFTMEIILSLQDVAKSQVKDWLMIYALGYSIFDNLDWAQHIMIG